MSITDQDIWERFICLTDAGYNDHDAVETVALTMDTSIERVAKVVNEKIEGNSGDPVEEYRQTIEGQKKSIWHKLGKRIASQYGITLVDLVIKIEEAGAPENAQMRRIMLQHKAQKEKNAEKTKREQTAVMVTEPEEPETPAEPEGRHRTTVCVDTEVWQMFQAYCRTKEREVEDRMNELADEIDELEAKRKMYASAVKTQ